MRRAMAIWWGQGSIPAEASPTPVAVAGAARMASISSRSAESSGGGGGGSAGSRAGGAQSSDTSFTSLSLTASGSGTIFHPGPRRPSHISSKRAASGAPYSAQAASQER